MEVPPLEEKLTEAELTWGSLCHFSALMGLVWWAPVFHNWVPVGHLVGPLLVWILKRKSSPYVDRNGKEALNFQLFVTVCALLLSFLPFGLLSTYAVTGLAVCSACLAIKAGVRVSNGKPYRYPLIPWRLLQG